MLHHPHAAVGDAVPQILHQWLQELRICFTAPSWEHVLVLVMGALLAPGKRTVSSCLRMTGRAEAANFASYHQILNRACWSPRAVARLRIPTKPATDSDQSPATHSAFIPAGIPI